MTNEMGEKFSFITLPLPIVTHILKYINLFRKPAGCLLLAVTFLASCNDDKQPEKVSNFCDSIHRNDSISLSQELEGLEEKMES